MPLAVTVIPGVMEPQRERDHLRLNFGMQPTELVKPDVEINIGLVFFLCRPLIILKAFLLDDFCVVLEN